ncbi:hypothetical protein SeLEV6574_g00237 [Synchytrium endobioticum]|uniref:Uncharacterized protein n=1 Tax=Synchytrium endobioticum TaxID=286115 RepID=A0A507DKS4_9FUNG|nr:hypothetical protein SeLEV6574_g00237 [Synchytrium endobioticum]
MGIKYFWKYLTTLNVVKEKLGSVDSKLLFGVTGNAAPKGVFFNCDEGKVLDPLDRSKGLEKRDKSFSRISKARALLVANRGNRGNNYLLKAHWTPSPFRPLQSVGEVRRYTYSTIDRTTPMKCPVPPILKASPKVVEFDSDKYEEVKEVPKAKAVRASSKAKAKRAPSGRSSRKIVKNDFDEETPKKNFTDATRAIASLSQRCGGYRTIHVGHLRGHVCIDQKEIIARRINDAVGIVNRARAIAERATEMLIEGICSSNQDTHLLLQLTHGGKGGARSFQKTVREVAGVDAKATRAAFMKNPSKGRLLDEVFLLPPEMLAKSRYVLDDSPRRYVRTSSFKTNGQVLCLLWIDTSSKPSPPDRKVEDAIDLPNVFSNKSLQSSTNMPGV